jgi:hypothetical protein
MRTIARGWMGLDETTITWDGTRHTVADVREFLDGHGVQDYRITLHSTEIGGSRFRVEIPN